jgi:hypothetical protein
MDLEKEKDVGKRKNLANAYHDFIPFFRFLYILLHFVILQTKKPTLHIRLKKTMLVLILLLCCIIFVV